MTMPKGAAVVGVDGCPAGWIAVVKAGLEVSALVVATLAELLAQVPDDALIAVDIPIGLTDAGARVCDSEARKLLGPGRGSSVFPAPIRPVLEATDYLSACAIREAVEGKRMSRQAFAILPKIREVDVLLRTSATARQRVREVHPEVCFAHWNGGPMKANKKKVAGKIEREQLIEGQWPGVLATLQGRWPRAQVGRDDINDAFAALWTTERILAGTARRIPEDDLRDSMGLPMEMWA